MAAFGNEKDPKNSEPSNRRPSVLSQKHEIHIKVAKNKSGVEDDDVKNERLVGPYQADSRRLSETSRRTSEIGRRLSESGRKLSNSGSGTDVAQFNVWKRKASLPATELDKAPRRSDFSLDEVFNTTLLNINKTPAAAVQVKQNYFSNKQTKTLGTLVPNEIINNHDLTKKDLNTFVGVLLFADVSGFTALCEKYNNTGKGGTYHLTATLNGYIGAMVEVIYSRGGDVLKFSGDAFLAVWKVGKHEYIYNTIHEVLSCAMHIQCTLGTYKTDVKVFLKVKLAVSAGNVTFCVIGDALSRHYLLGGAPIKEVKAAEKACVSGDVVISPSAWGHCSPANYDHVLADEGNVKITRILYNPSVKKRQLVMTSFVGPPSNTDGEDKFTRAARKSTPDATFEGESGDPRDDPDHYVRSLRIPVDVTAVHWRLGGLLRPFMIPPVAQQVDADQPLEFLTEMRQVTTVFVNVRDNKLTTNQLLRVTDEVYCIVCKLVRGYMGCVNKVSLFDKDVMLLCIFGLRGFKNELEGRSGLRCAHRILHELSGLDGVLGVSVGVTTGMCYCGVVGHPLRREYTVIGVTVNKAARIMCAYPDKVTCDQMTCVTSKLPAASFILQEPKPLKGITTVGHIYQYTEIQRSPKEGIPSLPLLGRSAEMKVFRSALTESTHRGMLVLGEARVGKTRLLDEMCQTARLLDYTTVSVALDSYHVTTPYSVAYLVMKQVLGLEESSTMQEREQLLAGMLGYEVGRDWLCYLNTAMQVQFPKSVTFVTDDANARREIAGRLYQNLIMLATDRLVVCVDNAHFVDAESWWELLVHLLNDEHLFIAMTMFDGGADGSGPIAAALAQDYRVVTVKLGGLDEAFMAPLACQLLGVQAIPPELEYLLKTCSHGNPGWCDSYLTSLEHSGGLSKVDLTRADLLDASMVVPRASLVGSGPLLSRVSFGSSSTGDDSELDPNVVDDKSSVDVTRKVSSTTDATNAVDVSSSVGSAKRSGLVVRFSKDINAAAPPTADRMPKKLSVLTACVISSDFEIRGVVPQNMEVIITQAFDCLPPYDQLFLKCGSVLGDTFSRRMVNAVMPNATLRQTVDAVRRFFEIRLLDCGEVETPGAAGTSVAGKYIPVCHCSRDKEDWFIGFEHLPPYSFCKFLRFSIPSFRCTTYELLPGNQKTEFHARAVRFLEAEPHQCVACGGGGGAGRRRGPRGGAAEERISVQALEQKLLSQSTESRRRLVRFLSQDYHHQSSSIHPAADQSKETDASKSADQLVKPTEAAATESILKQTSSIALSSKPPRQVSSAPTRADGPPGSTISLVGTSVGVAVAASRLELSAAMARSEAEEAERLDARGSIAGRLKKLKGALPVETKQSFMPLGNVLSKMDFRFCECPAVLTEVYQQLIEHSLAAGLLKKRVEFLIGYGSASIALGDHEQAVRLLKEARELSSADIFPVKATREFNLGKIESLIGKAHMELGTFDTAREHIHKALVHLGQGMQDNRLLSGVRVQYQMWQFWLKWRLPKMFNRQLSGADTETTDEVSACLATLCNLLMMEEKWGLARLAALRSLNHARRHCHNIFNLATAYSNAMDVLAHLGRLSDCRSLEAAALKNCRVKVALQEANDLSALGRLYCAAFVARWQRGKIVGAIKIGFRILQISSRIYTNNVKLYVLPQLIQALVMNGRVGESVDLLVDLQSNAADGADQSPAAWYHLLCLEMLLCAGVALESADSCLVYSEQLADGWYEVAEPLVERRIVAATWLWFVRRKDWVEAERWEKLAEPLASLRSSSNLGVLLTLLQCHLVMAASRVAPTERAEYHRRHAAPLIAALRERAAQVRIVAPRVLHLRAYSYLILKRKKKAMQLFAQCKQASIEQENDMEEAWVDHSIANVEGRLSAAQRDFWLEHSANDNIDWPKLMLYTWSNIMYTLPVDNL